MAKKGNQNTGGKKGRKIGRNAEKCARIRKGLGKKFNASREHRHCGSLARYDSALRLLHEYKADDPYPPKEIVDARHFVARIRGEA